MKELNSSIMRLNACVAKGYSHLKVGLVAALFAACLYPVNGYAQSFKKEGNVYVQVKKASSKSEPKKTGKYYRDSKGDNYPIYVSGTGSCFIIKVSKKTGNEYRQYLGKDISADICKELGIEYKPKSSK